MKLNPAQLGRLGLQLDRSRAILARMVKSGANQYGHGLYDDLISDLKRQSEDIRRIGRSLGQTRDSLQVSRYKREVWSDRARRQSHLHSVTQVQRKLDRLLALITEIFSTTKDRDSPNGGIFDLSKEIADGFKNFQDYQAIVSVDLRNDIDTYQFQSADMVADPFQSVIMLVGLGLELFRLTWEKRKSDRKYADEYGR